MSTALTCPHLSGEVCEIASRLSGQPITTTPPACAACAAQSAAQAVNSVTVSIAMSQVDADRRKRIYATHKALIPVGKIDPEKASQRLRAIQTGHGPGSQLWRVLESLGIEHTGTCQCLGRAEQMNAWGVAGCRQARAEIVDWMREGQSRYRWGDIAAAAAKAIASGLAWRLSLSDPYGSLVDEAIRRAATWDAESANVKNEAVP